MGGFLLSFITSRYLVFTFVFLPIAAVSFSACHRGQSGTSNALEDRVKEFWERRIAGEDLKAYAYEAYAKTGSMSAEQYVRARSPSLKYKAYKIKEVEQNGDQATVKVDVAYHLIMPARGELDLGQEMTERWVRLDGQWYRQESKQDEKPSAQ